MERISNYELDCCIDYDQEDFDCSHYEQQYDSKSGVNNPNALRIVADNHSIGYLNLDKTELNF